MIERKANLFYVTILTTITFLSQMVCSAQETTTIQGDLNAEGFNEIRIQRFSPDRVSQKRLLFPVNDGKFKISFDIQKPEMIRIFNNYILIAPKKIYNLCIKGSNLKIISEGFNNELISIEDDYESLSSNFWSVYEKEFNLIEYKNKIVNISANSINSLIKSKRFLLSKEEETIVLNYIISKDIFYYSIPFVSDKIAGPIKDQMANIIFKRITSFSNGSFEDRSEDFDNALTNFYIKWLYKDAKSFSNLLLGKYWNISVKLKKIIAGQFIQAYANNKIILTKPELIILKNLMCGGKASKDEYCDYYISKIEYGNLLLNIISQNDHLISPQDSVFSLPTLFHNRNSYVYFWASWCVPCITFIEKFDMETLAKDTSLTLVFISIEDSKDAWRKKNFSLGITAPSYLIKDGLKSGFAKELKIDHVPFFISINNNRIDKLNVPKEVFLKYMKQ